MKKAFITAIIVLLSFITRAQKIKILIENGQYRQPITAEIAQRSVDLLNRVLNLDEFRDSLVKYSFVPTNKPSLSENGTDIRGIDVYNDFTHLDSIAISLKVSHLWNPWKRVISGTMGETNPKGRLIVTYPYWLRKTSKKDLVTGYATHIGHEIFHTNWYGYIHEPQKGAKSFVNDRDVTYKIDDIIGSLVNKYYRP